MGYQRRRCIPAHFMICPSDTLPDPQAMIYKSAHGIILEPTIKLHHACATMATVMCSVWLHDLAKATPSRNVFNVGYRPLDLTPVFQALLLFVFGLGRWRSTRERCRRWVGVPIFNSLGCKIHSRCPCRRIRPLVLIGLYGVGVNGVRLGIIGWVRGRRLVDFLQKIDKSKNRIYVLLRAMLYSHL